MKYYFKPTSLTWWAGIASVLTGVALIFYPASYATNQFGAVLIALTGGYGSDPNPSVLIYTGLGLIGIRAKLEENTKQ